MSKGARTPRSMRAVASSAARFSAAVSLVSTLAPNPRSSRRFAEDSLTILISYRVGNERPIRIPEGSIEGVRIVRDREGEAPETNGESRDLLGRYPARRGFCVTFNRLMFLPWRFIEITDSTWRKAKAPPAKTTRLNVKQRAPASRRGCQRTALDLPHSKRMCKRYLPGFLGPFVAQSEAARQHVHADSVRKGSARFS